MKFTEKNDFNRTEVQLFTHFSITVAQTLQLLPSITRQLVLTTAV